ncbi:MAG: M48 family metallopeptidase [Victivallales bacterium]|nr:M48 family metallopeptidase [Victivallales bacterium]
MKLPLLILLMAYVLTQVVDYALEILNLRYLRKYGQMEPEEFAGLIDADLLRRTEQYTMAHTRLGIVDDLCSEAATLIFIFSGLLFWYAGIVGQWQWPFVLSGLAFFLILELVRALLDVPFDLFNTFRLEKRFGFNRMTPRIWLADQLKSRLLSMIISGLLLGGALWLYAVLPQWWWLAVWAFYLFFSVFMMYLAPYVLEPLFNKFTPIEDDALVERVAAVLARAGIKVKGVFKMDASRRTSHTNAYFTGIGREKRIVLYDTLLQKLDTDEIVAVLAHEAGHCRHRHIIKMLLLFETGALMGAYLAFVFLGGDWLARLFGFPAGNLFTRVVLLGFAAAVVTWPLSPLFNWLSRRFEREADAFACEMVGDGGALASALVKLSKDNLSNLHPHPCYAAFHYSHPPVIERIRYLQAWRRPPAAGEAITK